MKPIFVGAHLENLLDATGYVIMLRSHNVGVHDTGSGVQWVHSRVDAQLSNGTRQHGGGVQVSESGSRGRISQVISRNIYGL